MAHTIELNDIKFKRSTRSKVDTRKTNSTLVPKTFIYLTDESKVVYVTAVNDYYELGASTGSVIGIEYDDESVITTLTEKTDLVDDDILLIEDSENSYTKKKVKVSNLNLIIEPASNKAYICGGYTPTVQKYVDLIQFSTLAVSSNASELSSVRYDIAPVQCDSTQRGYAMGGHSGSVRLNNINRVAFSDDTFSSIAATLSVSRQSGGNGLNSLIRGYTVGGHTGSYSNEIDGIRFDTEAAVNPSATSPQAMMPGSVMQTETKGYCGGGINSSSQYLSLIFYLLYSNESVSSLSATLALARRLAHGMESATKGYVLGGHNASGYQSEIDGILFSNESAINPSATLTANRGVGAGVSDISNDRGFVCGGYNGSAHVSSIESFSYSTETVATTTSNLRAAISYTYGINQGSL
jgi:hypothetical protein